MIEKLKKYWYWIALGLFIGTAAIFIVSGKQPPTKATAPAVVVAPPPPPPAVVKATPRPKDVAPAPRRSKPAARTRPRAKSPAAATDCGTIMQCQRAHAEQRRRASGDN